MEKPVSAPVTFKVKVKSTGQEPLVAVGAGDGGTPLKLQAGRGERFELIGPETGKAPPRLRAQRKGRDLQILAEGVKEPDVVIEGYFDEAIGGDIDLLGRNADDRLVSYSVDRWWYPPLGLLTAEPQAIVLTVDWATAAFWQPITTAAAGAWILDRLFGGPGSSPPPAPSGGLAPASDSGLSGDQLTRITKPVFQGSGARPGAASIFVNNRYHASLVPGAWSQLCLASGPATLATRHTLAANNPAKDRFDAVSTLTLTGGQVQYLRVNMRTEQSELGPVPAEQALQEMASTREQLHTVSRVTQTCAEIATAKSPRPTAAR